MKPKTILLSIFILCALFVQSQIKVAAVLTDNMVLQRNSTVKLWGIANPNEKLIVITSWNNTKTYTHCDKNGKWEIQVKTNEAGGPYTLSIASTKEKVSLKNIMLGEVWICSGQSNMDMPIRGYVNQPINGENDILVEAENKDIRLFTMNYLAKDTQQYTCEGKSGGWKIASAASVSEFSAVAYFYARQLYQKLKVPVGVICTSWGGSRIEAWMSKETISNFPEALKQTSDEKSAPHHRASLLYNGMISPILNYTIKGAIWYQGESNRAEYTDYSELMAAMVSNWRKDFGQGDFPFYYVQIAPFSYGDSKATVSACLRDEQVKAMSLIPNSGMVTTIDIGDEKVIHPPEKLTVGKRLAYWALSETYGIKGINFRSPTYKSMSVKDSVAIIEFNDALYGLSSFGKEVECFEIAGADQLFYPAKIKINSEKQVLISAKQVKEPVAVRYGFSNFPQTKGFLYNTAGLPVPSFRTDNWDKL